MYSVEESYLFPSIYDLWKEVVLWVQDCGDSVKNLLGDLTDVWKSEQLLLNKNKSLIP